jgi:rhodanese-related sulfurtransferase
MRLISAQELKEKLDRGEPVKLVNALGDWEYRAAHIPGSLHFSTPEDTLKALDRDDEIVVHCSNPSCMASVMLYRFLERNGYRNIRRFAGGLQEWQQAGDPLEGDMAEAQAQGGGPRTSAAPAASRGRTSPHASHTGSAAPAPTPQRPSEDRRRTCLPWQPPCGHRPGPPTRYVVGRCQGP